MVVFYAFCRTIDDLADDISRPPAERTAALDAWEAGIRHGFTAPDDFQREVLDLRAYFPNDQDPQQIVELIEHVE